MKKNIGNADRIARIVVGLVALGAGYYMDMNYWIMGIGAIVLITGLMNSCLIYSMLGMSTVSKKEETAIDPEAPKAPDFPKAPEVPSYPAVPQTEEPKEEMQEEESSQETATEDPMMEEPKEEEAPVEKPTTEEEGGEEEKPARNA